ncbi:hypothetical protein FZZ92_10745 [Synechococcus sp. MU1611]|nr:hypothetical protein [Synechococcus sp. MU1611]
MKRLYLLIFFLFLSSGFIPSKANFGDADFPAGSFEGGPKSYHDAWCRKIKQECRVRFQGSAMWVEGQGGIYRDQYLSYRYEKESREFYNYIHYIDDAGRERVALFLFANVDAQREFIKSFLRWKKQAGRPTPNLRLPASQGPQDTQGRDKSYGVPMNPYERPPITDWKEKTTP